MRIVVKIGTNILTGKTGGLDTGRIQTVANALAAVKKSGGQAVLVTSGAIAAGMARRGMTVRPKALREKQALAAIGQPLLMHAYENCFTQAGLAVAQLLLTRQDFDDHQRYINLRNTLLALLDMGVVPIINENDTVAVDEIKFGENDTLSALVAAKIAADRLFIFTDVDGLYPSWPAAGAPIPVVEKITPEIEAYASGTSGSGKGVGGMTTKLAAAKIAAAAGVTTTIMNGTVPDGIARVLSGEHLGTTVLPGKALDHRKCWIAFGAQCRGRLTIDAGAADAVLHNGKSLLPSGITAVDGSFEVGETVSIIGPDGREIARGLAAFTAADMQKIKGRRSGDIAALIESAGAEEAVHRDNMVVL
jgi:glutamate 5-kinase